LKKESLEINQSNNDNFSNSIKEEDDSVITNDFQSFIPRTNKIMSDVSVNLKRKRDTEHENVDGEPPLKKKIRKKIYNR